LREAQDKGARGELVMGRSQTVEAFLIDWLASKNVRPTTQRRYAQIVSHHLVPALGRYKLQSLQPEHVERMLRDRPHLSNRGRHHLRAVLRTALNKALRQGKVTKNAAALAEVSGGRPARPGVALDAEQALHFLRSVEGDPLEVVYVLALNLGMREGELLGLQWEAVDFTKRTIRVHQQVQPNVEGKLELMDTKSAKGHRLLPMTDDVVGALQAHKARTARLRLQAGSAYVFTTRTGKPHGARNVIRSFKRALKRAGLPEMRFHDLRHSCNSLLEAQGVSARVRMEILGHSDIRLTENVYTHVVPASMREGVESLGRVLAFSIAN
jgi:integrase